MFTRNHLAAALALGLACASFTGAAVAGNGNDGSAPGNSASAPGQEKKAEAPAPAAQPAPAPAKKTTSQPTTKSTSKGQAKKTASTSGVNSGTRGVKPSNTTSKWQKCETGGGQGTSATCATDPPTVADASKRYGNGKTAAQIANSRGAPADTLLTGPGNSQPHKVAVCPKKNNKSGGVDVHAVKSYDTSACDEQESVQQSQQVLTSCPGTTVITTTTKVVAANKQGKVKAHGKAGAKGEHKGLTTSTVTSTSSTFTPSGAVCDTTQPPTSSAQATAAPQQTAQPVGGVAGVQASLPQQAEQKPAGGVLGTIAEVGETNLPFTGLPLWIALLAGLALAGAGYGVRRATR